MPLEETTEEGHIREIKLPCYLLYTKLAIAQAKTQLQHRVVVDNALGCLPRYLTHYNCEILRSDIK